MVKALVDIHLAEESEFYPIRRLERCWNEWFLTLMWRRGEFVILRGPSGGGKTSLLNILGTIDLASSGEIGWRILLIVAVFLLNDNWSCWLLLRPLLPETMSVYVSTREYSWKLIHVEMMGEMVHENSRDDFLSDLRLRKIGGCSSVVAVLPRYSLCLCRICFSNVQPDRHNVGIWERGAANDDTGKVVGCTEEGEGVGAVEMWVLVAVKVLVVGLQDRVAHLVSRATPPLITPLAIGIVGWRTTTRVGQFFAPEIWLHWVEP